MRTAMTCSEHRPAPSVGYALLGVCFAVVLMLTAGCSSGGSGSTPTATPAPQAVASDGYLSTLTAALSQGQFTLNNPWTQADLDDENIRESIGYQQTIDGHPAGQVRPYTTLVQQYRARRKQCERDSSSLLTPGSYNTVYTFQDRKCYPTQTQWPNDFAAPVDPITGKFVVDPASAVVLARYGYYCGAGYPNFTPFADKAPEPLDSVDYCCRLHDAAVWGTTTAAHACGMVMCLSKASGWPANVMTQMPDVETARQYWYDAAATLCGGNQSNDAPPPVLGP